MTITHIAANYGGNDDLTADLTTFDLPFNELVGGSPWIATAGRLLYLVCPADKTVGTYTDPDGWTPINKRVGADVSLGVWYRVAQGGESSVTLAWSTGIRFAGACVIEEDSITANGMASISANSGTGTVDHIASGSVDPGRPALAIAVVAVDSCSTWGGISSQPTWSDSYNNVVGQDDTGTPGSNNGFPGWSIATKSVSGSTSVDPTWTPSFDQAAITLAVFPLRLGPLPAQQPRMPAALLAR